jgi:aminoglycoside N3'-acetyltransferase
MLTKTQLKNNLKRIKIKEKFIIIHSDITGLYFKNFSLKDLWKIILSSFGKDKTYIFPAFTLKKKNLKWVYSKSRSDAGLLSEYFRKQISDFRTIHPLHSVCVFGKNKDKIKIGNSSSSFGKGSFWEWACNSKDVCNLSLGLNLEGGATFCHYPEEFMKVNYRKYVKLNTKVYDKKNNIIKNNFFYFARKKSFYNNWKRCEADLFKYSLIKKYVFIENDYKVLKMNTNKVYKFLIKKIEKNLFYLVK